MKDSFIKLNFLKLKQGSYAILDQYLLGFMDVSHTLDMAIYE